MEENNDDARNLLFFGKRGTRGVICPVDVKVMTRRGLIAYKRKSKFEFRGRYFARDESCLDGSPEV
jgi:hypothetical protein